MDALLDERKVLLARIEQQQEQLGRLQNIVARVAERLAHDENVLHEINCVLGQSPQLRIQDADVRLRGRRLEEIAVAILADERGTGVDVHYREWFELLRHHGHLVGGKEPLNTFLAQINRSRSVEATGGRTGLYRLAAGAQ